MTVGAHITPTTRDLDTRAQIHDLVVRFYREIVFDDLLGPVFDQVAEVDWAAHIPRLIDFWCRVLLDEPGYDGYMLQAHQAVHELEPFTIEFFDRWYLLFIESVDACWHGPIAEKAKAHAAHMAGVLARRVAHIDWHPPAPTMPETLDTNAAARPKQYARLSMLEADDSKEVRP